MFPTLLLAPSLMAAELTVGSSADYATIREAVAAASSGDVITVQPGSYTESLWIGVNLELRPSQGFGSVIIDGSEAGGAVVTLVAGTVRGMVITGAPDVAVELKGGSARLEQSAVHAPGGVGVLATANAPKIIEVAVYDAGEDAFSFTGGSPTATRCLAVDPASSGFDVSTDGSYTNLVAIGGEQGFSVGASTDLHHVAALDSAEVGVSATRAGALSNAVISDNPTAVDCGGLPLELGWSLLWAEPDTQGCDAGSLHDNLEASPALVSWRAGARPPLVDLRPQASSPLVDAGQGSDGDGSAADIGPFGGAEGAWTDSDADGVPIHFDCDDGDPLVGLHAEEIHDGKDNDCDGRIDEDPSDTGEPEDTAPELDTRDIDGDGWSEADGDCEDHNVATWPGATEITDGADNDCDGLIDEGTWLFDDDEDGWSEREGDCDDGDPERNPGAEEGGADGVDHDCDGTADGPSSQDSDGDGFTVGGGDCDDTRPGVHPDAFDGIDGIDGDCDGVTDDDGLARDADDDGVSIGELDCRDDDISISPTSPELPDDGVDQDCDGVDLFDVDGDGHPSLEAGGEDCDDTRAETHPGAAELCDGLDNDCDGKVDELCTGGAMDGPDAEPWETGIHGGCNCTSTASRAAAWPLLALLTLIGPRRRRGSPRA
jgi:hypothetical protein